MSLSMGEVSSYSNKYGNLKVVPPVEPIEQFKR